MIYSTARTVIKNYAIYRVYKNNAKEIKRCLRIIEDISINGYGYKPLKEIRVDELKIKIEALYEIQLEIYDKAKKRTKILVPYRFAC